MSGFPWSKNNYRYFTELRRITEESIMRDCKNLTVLFNTGIHDLFSSKFSMQKYKIGLNYSMVELRDMLYSLQQRSRTVCNQSVSIVDMIQIQIHHRIDHYHFIIINLVLTASLSLLTASIHHLLSTVSPHQHHHLYLVFT